jgi:hypothetical protein
MQYSASIQSRCSLISQSALFVGSKSQDEVAVGNEALPFHANEIGDQDGIAFLHVVGATTVEVAVFLDELERIGGPVFAAGFDDVEVADEQNGITFSGAVDAGDHVFLAVGWPGDLDVCCWKAGVAEAHGHGFGGGGDVTDGISGIDLDELLENFAGQEVVSGIFLRAGYQRANRDCRE